MAAEPGASLGQVSIDVEAGKVRELARALRAPEDVVPPSFTVVAAHTTEPGRSPNELVIEAAGLDQERVLLGEMRWTYRRPIAVGDHLTGAVRHLGTETKQGARGTLRFARGAVEWRDAAGDEVVTVHVTLIEAPEGAAS